MDTGLAAGVGFGYYTQRNVGPITLIIQTTPDKAKAAVAAAYNEVAHFNDPDYFTDEELTSRRRSGGRSDYSREKASGTAHDRFGGHDGARILPRLPKRLAPLARYISRY